MPLNQKVAFKTVLQGGNRVQVPKLVRWQFKMETDQVLKVGAYAPGQYSGWQFFYAKMTQDGRIHLPKLTIELLKGQKTNLTGCVLEITIEPA